MHLLIGILGYGSAIVELKCRVQARIHWKIRQREDEIRKCSSPDWFNNKKEILEMPYHIMEAGVAKMNHEPEAPVLPPGSNVGYGGTCSLFYMWLQGQFSETAR